MKQPFRGFTLVEMLIVVAVVIALTAIGFSIMKSSRQKADQAAALQKMRSLGAAFATYTTDKNGLLPFEDASGTDDWATAAKPENQEAWYNALPRIMGAQTVGEIGIADPELLYKENHPLFIPGAPYPGKNKRANSPAFALGMNSRLQRKDESGIKTQGRFDQIMEPAKTVVLLERGLPDDKKTIPAQGGFDGSPKAGAKAFAARHNQKGCLIFADGHAELRRASELINPGGAIITPQREIVWTMNPDDDPN